MITESDRHFLDGLQKVADKEARRKAREEAALLAEQEGANEEEKESQ